MVYSHGQSRNKILEKLLVYKPGIILLNILDHRPPSTAMKCKLQVVRSDACALVTELDEICGTPRIGLLPHADIGGISETSGQSNPQLAGTSNDLCCELGTCGAPAAPPGPPGPEPNGPNVPPKPVASPSQSSSAGKSKSISIIVGCAYVTSRDGLR